ncbi:MAG: hypothetical protein M0038_17125, partial [Pseudomonadota bacterium]|nr:hypothetical protein [Pseudomonadota bacterium]
MGFFTPIAAKPSPEVEPVPGAPAQPAAASGAPAAGNASFFGALPVQSAAPTAAQQARSAWAKMPGWEHPLAFALHGVNDIGAGIENVLGINPKGAVPTAVDNFLERFQHKPLSQPVINALERQHPWYNYGVKWPAELVASAPLGEAAGGLAAGVMKGLGAVAPEGAGLAERALYALPRSMATGAAYGVQQPRGNPALNAAIGAVTGPAVEGLASAAGGALRAGGNVLSSLTHVVKGRDLAQPEIEAALAREFADRGLPAQVPMRDLPEGVQLTTAAQSGDRGLLDLQAHLRSGKGATPRPFEELAVSNNKAIENGIRQALAPQPDTTALSEPAHELLQGAQERAKAVKNAAYAKFDALKGGLYLERPPIQDALREAYDRLLPAHQEALPAKLREVMSAISPLHLTNDIEDLSARLNDLYKTAEPGTT